MQTSAAKPMLPVAKRTTAQVQIRIPVAQRRWIPALRSMASMTEPPMSEVTRLVADIAVASAPDAAVRPVRANAINGNAKARMPSPKSTEESPANHHL
jgi:hypothetical protein